MIRVVLLAIIVLGAAAFAAYTLSQLDQIVHGQLYKYGLKFSLEWANPYWNLLRVTLILIDVIAVSTVIGLALTLRKYRAMQKICERKTRTHRQRNAASPLLRSLEPERPQIMPQQQTVTSIRAPKPAATPSPPLSPPATSEASGSTRCSHCGKAFTQPLRMLDFQGDRPRIVNICPFCNEIVASSQTEKEGSQASGSQGAQTTN